MWDSFLNEVGSRLLFYLEPVLRFPAMIDKTSIRSDSTDRFGVLLIDMLCNRLGIIEGMCYQCNCHE